MTPETALNAVADCYGWTRNGKHPFIAAGAPISAPTRDALEALAISLGLYGRHASAAQDSTLIGLYARALKSIPSAQRTALTINRDAGNPSAALPPPVAAPSAPVAAPYDDTALQGRINTLEAALITAGCSIGALEREVQELQDTTPRVVTIQAPNVPAVTFTHAHPMLERVIRYAVNRRHVWLCGPRGSGKSTAGTQVAHALGLPFYCMTGASDEFAFSGYERPFNGIVTCPQFRSAWLEGGVILLDELDTFNPAAVVYLNDALANGWCTFPDGRFEKHADCIVLAGTNTNGLGATEEYTGRAPLDGATLDRFKYVYWGYDKALENSLSVLPAWTQYVQALRAEFERQSIPHAPSPRASINGSRDILTGDTWEEAAEGYIWRGMADDVRKRLERAVPMSNYQVTQAANLAA